MGYTQFKRSLVLGCMKVTSSKRSLITGQVIFIGIHETTSLIT